MQTVTAVLLIVTLLLCGGYAGMILMCQIGVLPAMRDLRPAAYADVWRAMDDYMDRLMPPYKGTLMFVNLAVLVALLILHYPWLAVSAGVSLLCTVAGLVLTIRQQFPVNAQIKAAPADAPDAVLTGYRDRTIQGFRVRFFLAVASFAVLCCGVVLWPIR